MPQRVIRTGGSRLYLSHSFIYGFASIADFAGLLYRPVSDVPADFAESHFMWSAWASVGDAMRSVMDEYPQEQAIAYHPAELETV